jgi:cell division protein FtsZ
MKGARGLLISITGGKDLTLYEVDEAATRIREEVDQEANIIVGATFDEGLEGIIRVSVVATGIDMAQAAARPPAESRVAELTHRLRADTQRLAAERTEPHHQQQAQPQARTTPAPAAPRHAVEQAATAAVAAALSSPSMEDVTVRPITPKPSLFVEPVMAEPAPQEMPKAFIPPQPERARGPRMPRIEELPLPGQNQLRARQGEVSESGPEKQRMSLLQRLAQVGLGRRDDSEAQSAAHQPPQRPAMPQADRMPAPPRPQPQPPLARTPDPVSEYAKRAPSPAPQGLDIHGRQSLPVHKAVDDDQLEIPAFLRRQAN